MKIFDKIRDNHEKLFRLFLFFISVVIIVYVFPRQAKFKYEFTKGKPWMHETIIAPFDFSILKSDAQIEKEIEIINKEHLPIFYFNDEVFENKAQQYINQFEEKWSENNNLKKDDKFTFVNIFKKNNSDYNSKKYDLAIFGYDKLQSIYDKGIIQLNGEFEYRDNLNIFLKRGSIAEKIKMDEFYSINSAANEINSLNKLSEEEYKFLIPILLSSLDHNVIYDEYTTENMLNTQLDNINVTQGLIVAGQVLLIKVN